MSDTSTDSVIDPDRIRKALIEELKVHVRITEQGHAPDLDARRKLAAALPDIIPFGDQRFHDVKLVLDWDHQIPSQYTLLRILASYDADTAERIDANIEHTDEEIASDNLYPEFDLPDYGDVEGSETYVAILRPGATAFEDFRFLSTWRKHVSPQTAEIAVTIARNDPRYHEASAARKNEGLGGPVVIGWTPPCLADSTNWAIEVWLLIEFDGHVGKARVFMIDPVEKRITKEFETDVQLA